MSFIKDYMINLHIFVVLHTYATNKAQKQPIFIEYLTRQQHAAPIWVFEQHIPNGICGGFDVPNHPQKMIIHALEFIFWSARVLCSALLGRKPFFVSKPNQVLST